LNIESLVEKYMRWEERAKWLLLRKTAYTRLRDLFSLENVDSVSHTDFKRHYLRFGSISVGDFEYKLTPSSISSVLQNYNVSKLEEMIRSGEIEVSGNASWSQLHMGFRKQRWHEARNGVKYLLFGNRNMPLGKIGESEVINRLRRVLEWDLSVAGFGRAKVTPLLLICDENDRFGVWNSVSDEALHKLRLKRKTDITKSRSVSEYLQANKALNKLKGEYGFNDLSDVDLFSWYFLNETRPGKPIKTRKPSSIISFEKTVDMFKQISMFEKEIRSFIFERLYEAFSDLWIVRAVPKEVGIHWQKRREGDIREGKPPERQLINYADFSDYKEIIFYNWKNVFSRYFRDKEKLRVRMDDLNNLCRKTTMHVRTITEDEIGLGKVSIRWLRSRMKSIQ